MKILRRKSDLKSVALIGFTFFLMLFFLSTSWSFFSFPVYLLSFLLFSFFIFTCTLINHNHRHHLMFSSNTLNTLCNWIISLNIGAPSTRLHLVHHFNHHKYFPSLEDWCHPDQNAKGEGLLRIFTYLKNATSAMTKKRNSLVKTNHHRRALFNEKVLLYAFSAFALWWNWKVFLFFILPSWFLGLSLLLTSNLLNHDRCDFSDEINHSRDFINRFENVIFCNNGYHTAHHLNPHLHWEDLPLFHEKNIAPKKRPEFTSGSFFIYLLKYSLHQI